MKKIPDRIKKRYGFPVVCGIVFLIILFVFLILSNPSAFRSTPDIQEEVWTQENREQQKEDYRLLSTTEYDTVFLSMYPIDTFREEDYAYYRGMTIYKAACCIPSFSVLEDYMQHIADSGNTVTTYYLGIRPELTDPKELRKLLKQYPDATFEIILPYPSSEYWQSLSQEDYEKEMTTYRDFLRAAPRISEANIYFFGSQEWLIANPGNYLENGQINEDVSRTLLTHSDREHGYLITSKNASHFADALATLTAALRTAPPTYADLSEYCVIFFGDSVIGNYTDSTSIPGVVAGLTGAEAYNCGYGGHSAALGPNSFISLPGIVDAFFQRDLTLLPDDTQVYDGVASYLENASADKELCFVINYGLNDYFSGYPIESDDPYDIVTYCGAIRSAVANIRKNAPSAHIILCTPTFTAAFDNGMEPHGEEGNVLFDYVNAILDLSRELQTDALDTYHELGITPANENQHLIDQIHPNAACRFRIGSLISRMLQ